MKCASTVLVILLATWAVATAQEVVKPPPPPPEPPRSREAPLSPIPQAPHIASQVYLGEPAPDFELDGSEGRPVRLAQLKGYWVLLVFSDRREALAPLKGIHAGLRELGVRAYGICADKAHVLKSYAARQRLPVVLLSDVTGEISQLYGLYDLGSRSIRPGFVLMDRRGVVHMALLGQSMPMGDVLDMVKTAVGGT